jgi:hypothetical protein
MIHRVGKRCLRCEGCLVREWLRDPLELWSPGPLELPAWRCVNCGDVIDRLILERRQLRALFLKLGQGAGSRCAAVVPGEIKTAA